MPWWSIVGAAIGVAIVIAAWWWVPKREANRLRPEISDPKALADLEDSFRKTIAQLLGGAAVLFGAGLAFYQTQMTLEASRDQLAKQLQASHEQLAKQLQASHEQLVSQQVSKGFEQLGSEKLAVRLGGIYALEGVMNSEQQYQKPVLEALCSFVRDQTKTNATSATTRLSEGKRGWTSQLPIDIQAVLTVVGRRANKEDVADLTVCPGTS